MPKRHKRKDKYAKIKVWAKAYYQRWRQEPTYSPAFGQDILITRSTVTTTEFTSTPY